MQLGPVPGGFQLNNPDKARKGSTARAASRLSITAIAQRSTRASVVLFAGNFVSTGILAVSSIVIARLLGPSSYGSYTLVLLIPQIFQLFVGFGVNSAITRFSAYHIARGEEDVARRFSINSMVFLLLFGGALSAVCFVASGSVSADVLHRPELAPLVRDVSVAIIAQTALQASVQGLVGWNLTGLASMGSILQAALRLAIAPALVVSGFGVLGALTGYTAGYLIAGTAAGAAFYVLRLRRTQERRAAANFVADVKELVSYGLPVYTGNVLGGVASYFVTLLVALIATNAVVGYYQAANNITSAYTLALAAITLALFPAFSSLHGAGADTASAFRRATKFVAYIMTPAILFIAGAAGAIMRILYGPAFSAADTYLVLLAVSDIPLVLGSTVASAFFNGVGKTRLSLAVGAASASALVVSAPLLGDVFGLGVDGLIYALFVSNALSGGAGLYFAARYLGATVDLRSVAATFAASAMGYVAVVLTSGLALSDLFSLAVDVLVFFGVYFTAAPVLRAIDASDVETLGTALGGMGAFAGVLRPIIRYELFVARRLGLGRQPA